MPDMDEPSLIPPSWFVEQFNARQPADRYRTALDPLIMLAWHQVTRNEPGPLILVMGI